MNFNTVNHIIFIVNDIVYWKGFSTKFSVGRSQKFLTFISTRQS